ncbi:hypothetical protein ACMGE6_00215 [Macrococcus equi]|uniref:hypothetical protein n=1 Tax=Macrococcus equi TaxID=3395462 RepID=UPI0039BE192A
MKKFWSILLTITVVLYLAATVVFTIFHQQFKHLNLKDDVKSSNCILVYNPENDRELLQEAKQQLDKNPKSKLIYSPFVVNSNINSLKLLKEEKINKSQVIPEYYSTSMKSSSEYVADIMHQHNMNNCIIVGRDYEMKRLVETFEKNNPLFEFYHKSVQLNGKSYLETTKGRKKAEHELWQYPKLWLNR